MVKFLDISISINREYRQYDPSSDNKSVINWEGLKGEVEKEIRAAVDQIVSDLRQASGKVIEVNYR